MIPRNSKLRWLWRAPARALGRARDYYVRSVTGCARYVPADAAFGSYPVLVPAPLPRSYSCGSAGYRGAGTEYDDDDLRELIRAASQRRDGHAQLLQAQAAATRSQSTAGLSAATMARIDEDAPCEFGAGVGGALYTRSSSCVGGADGKKVSLPQEGGGGALGLSFCCRSR